MLTVLFTLDCDECHRVFEHAVAAKGNCDDVLYPKWLDAADQLTYFADSDGWSTWPAYLCDNCLRVCLQEESASLSASMKETDHAKPIRSILNREELF